LNQLGAVALVVLLLAAPAAASAQQNESDNVIDARVRSSAAAAESYQGPLDGTWTLVAASGGQALYVFQLVDKPGGQSPVEGVWRDLRRPAMPGDIGLIDSLVRGPQSLAIAFVAKPGDPAVTIQLTSDAAGFWSGDLKEGGADIPVRMKRG
jgi:hypothetical protein